MQGYGEKELLNKVKPFRWNCEVNCFLKGVVQLPNFFLSLLSLHSAQVHLLSSNLAESFVALIQPPKKEKHPLPILLLLW